MSSAITKRGEVSKGRVKYKQDLSIDSTLDYTKCLIVQSLQVFKKYKKMKKIFMSERKTKRLMPFNTFNS